MIRPSSRAAAAVLACFYASTPSSCLAFVQPKASGPPCSSLSLQMTASSDTSTAAVSCAAVPSPPPTKTAAGIIFDIDGTLADSWRLGYDATVVVLQNNDLGHVEMNEDIYHHHCVYATPERLARHAGLMPGDENFENVGEDLGKQFDEHYVKLVSPKTCAFYPGMMKLLENLPQDTKLGAFTNACAAYGHAVIEANCPVRSALDNTYGLGFSLYSRFGTIHGADSVPAPKPSPEGLLLCAQELGLKDDLSNVIYVGDAVGDGKAARAAGMVSVGVLWGSNSEEKLRSADTFDYIVGSVEELRELLPQQE